MAGDRDERWYFSPEVLENSPSRKNGIDADKELSYRQQAANMIQDMGQRLQVTQLCINTAIVYMHRFFVFHSFTKYHRTSIATAALFLAAKVEEQPRKLEHVIKIAHMIQHQKPSQLDLVAEAAKLVKNENVMLQTLGFDIAIEHPHTFVVKCCQMVKASKDLAQTCYFMATNSLHLTTMCLKYKPTVVACVCIHLACKWSSWQIPTSSEGKSWWNYIDANVSVEKLEEITKEFLVILEKCPSRLKRKIMSGGGQGSGCDTLPPVPYDPSDGTNHSLSPVRPGSRMQADGKVESEAQPSTSKTSVPQSATPQPVVKGEPAAVPSAAVDGEYRTSPGRYQQSAAKQSYSVYKEKKEQERREQERKEGERHEAERKREEAERAERERRLEAERRVAAEHQREQERLDRERRDHEVKRLELEKREAERREKERRAEQERREAEKRDADRRAEQERLKAERVAAERREAERKAEQERQEAELRVKQEAELRQQQEERKRLEEQQRVEERRRQEEAAERQQEEQMKREAEKKNRFFTSRTVVPEPSFDALIATTRSEDLLVERADDAKAESPQKHHKSEKSHKKKKSKHHHKEKHKDKNRDKRQEKQESEPLPPIKLKIKPLQQPDPEPPAESFKIRIPKDRLLNHTSSAPHADQDQQPASRKRKNSFDAASLSKKPVV